MRWIYDLGRARQPTLWAAGALTVELREELMQLETEQLLWAIVVSGKGTAERRVVPLA